MANFAEMLKYLRERENLSQRELADKLGISKSAISMYEMGKRHPKFEDEEAIADFFNVDLNVLRGRVMLDKVNSAPTQDERSKRIIEYYANVPPEVQDAVEKILISAQLKP